LLESKEINHQHFFQIAYQEAIKAFQKDEIPIGAVIVKNNKIIAKAHNQTIQKKTVLAHAELIAIQKASKKLKNERLIDCSIYTTLEPCTMCSGAIIHARLADVFFLAYDNKLPAFRQIIKFETHNHFPRWQKININELDSSQLLKKFFKNKR